MGAGWKISDFVCGGLDSGLGRPGKSEPGDPTAYLAKNAPYFAPHERVRSRVAVSHPFAGFSRKKLAKGWGTQHLWGSRRGFISVETRGASQAAENDSIVEAQSFWAGSITFLESEAQTPQRLKNIRPPTAIRVRANTRRNQTSGMCCAPTAPKYPPTRNPAASSSPTRRSALPLR